MAQNSRTPALNADRKKRRPGSQGAQPGRKPPRRREPRRDGGPVWLYGRHVVMAALGNPNRVIEEVRATEAFLESHGEALERLASSAGVALRTTDGARLDRLLAGDAAHQGVVAAARPLDQPDVSEIRALDEHAVVVALDQGTDPRNVGAVIRAAAAFGAAAVVAPARGAPPETGALVKAAAGTFETIPYIQATNLARALETLKENGFWTVGLDGEADTPLAAVPFDRPTAIVLGAEGRGLRRLTAERSDVLAHIPIAPEVESLNVATAAAVALYERRRSSG